MGFPGTWMTESQSLVYRVVPKCACSSIGQIMYYSDHGEYFDGEQSVHRDSYRRLEDKFKAPRSKTAFTLPPEAVVKKVIHALESPRPRIRYRVTFPTHLFGVLKGVASDRFLDRLLKRG